MSEKSKNIEDKEKELRNRNIKCYMCGQRSVNEKATKATNIFMASALSLVIVANTFAYVVEKKSEKKKEKAVIENVKKKTTKANTGNKKIFDFLASKKEKTR